MVDNKHLEWKRIEKWDYIVVAVASEYHRKYDMVELEDIKQSLYKWFLEHPNKLNEWDKGHMAPAADFCYSREAMLATFSYANCALQHYKLNRGVWKELEAMERVWAQKDSMIIHIDVIFDANPKKTPGGAAIPATFRKTIIFYSTGKKLVYEFPNIPPTKTLDKYLIKGKL